MKKRKVNELQRKIDKANKRIKRLIESGLKPLILMQTVNTVGGDKISVKGVKDTAQRSFISRVVDKFLAHTESTVRGAKKAKKERRKTLEKTLKQSGVNVHANLIDIADKYIGSADFRQLLKDFQYEEEKSTVNELANIGVEPTASSVSVALYDSIDTVIDYEFKARGIELTGNELVDYYALARERGLDYALSVYYQQANDDTLD